ncbi:MAG: hypothetical protein IIC24_00645 [Chloroflexi bacterium]|nr:hypothetical protein [Chloroflexota bacterium]
MIAIAALSVAPTRDKVQMYFRLHPDQNIKSDLVVDFLRVLCRQLHGPVVVIWDGLQAHRSRCVIQPVQPG